MFPSLLASALLFSAPHLAHPAPAHPDTARQQTAAPEAEAEQLLAQARELEADGKAEEAIAQASQLVARFEKSTTPQVREVVDNALSLQGFTLFDLGRYEAGMAPLETLRQRWLHEAGDPGEQKAKVLALDLDSIVPRLSGASRVIQERNPEQEANPAFSALMKAYGHTGEPQVAEQVAGVMINRAYDLKTKNHTQAAIQLCEQVNDQFGAMQDRSVFERVNTALANQAGMLRDDHRFLESIETYEQVLDRNKAAGGDGKDEGSIRALRFIGINLTDLKSYDEAVPLFEEALRRLDGSDPETLEQKASTMINKAFALGRAGRHKDAIAEYDRLLRQFSDSENPAMALDLAIAMVNRGSDLNDLKRHEEAVAACDAAIQRYGQDTREEIQKQMSLACLNKGVALQEMGKEDAALACLDEVIRRVGEHNDATSLERVFVATHAKGNVLAKKHQYPQAIAALQALLDQHPQTGDRSLEIMRSQSLNSIGYWQILQAKKLWSNGGHLREVERQLYEALQGLQKAEKTASRGEEKAYFHGNMAYALYLLGRTTESAAPLKSCLREGGEGLYKGELEDADIHPCPPDQGFKALVEKTWKKVKKP